MALAPGTTTRLPAKNSGRYLAEGDGLRSDRATLAKRAVTPALLKSHDQSVSPLARRTSLVNTAPLPAVPFTPAAPSHASSSLLHHVGGFLSGKENIYGQTVRQAPIDRNVNAGVVVSPAVAMPLIKLAAAGLIGEHVGKAVPGVPGRVLRQAAESAVGAPAGAYELATSPAQTTRAIGKRYAYDYGPLLHGNLGEFAHRAAMDPLGVGLDAFTAASLLTGAAARAGVIKKAPETRHLNVPGTEGSVQPFRSPNELTAQVQHRVDRFSERHPNLPVVGAVPRVARRIGFEAERDFERAGAPAIPFMVAERQLHDPRLKVAYDVLHRYGPDEPAVAAQRLTQEIQMREGRMNAPDTPLIEKANQKKTLLLLKAAQPFVEKYAAEHGAEKASRGTLKLRNALAEGVPLANLGQETRIEMGQVQPESAAQRVEQSSRLVTGGKFVEARLSRTLEQARSDVNRLEARYAKTAEARDREAVKLLARETAKQQAGKPHTLETAQARLSDLQRQHEKFLQAVESRVTHEKIAPEEAAKLLAEHDRQVEAQRAEVQRLRSGAVDPENLKAFEAQRAAREVAAWEERLATFEADRQRELQHPNPSAGHLRALDAGIAQAKQFLRASNQSSELHPSLRPYSRNEPGGIAERSQRASDEEQVAMVQRGEKPAASLRIRTLDEAKKTARELQAKGLHVRIHRFRDEPATIGEVPHVEMLDPKLWTEGVWITAGGRRVAHLDGDLKWNVWGSDSAKASKVKIARLEGVAKELGADKNMVEAINDAYRMMAEARRRAGLNTPDRSLPLPRAPLEANVLVGKDAASVDRLHRAWRMPEGREADQQVGRALGYSEADVRNFVERKHGPPPRYTGGKSDRQASAAEQAAIRVAEKRLARLERERGRFEQAAKTGVLRHPHDKAETARRNLARRALGHVPTLREELRAHAEQEVERLIAQHPDHPSVQRYLDTVAEIDRLKTTIQDLQLKKLGGERLGAPDLARLGRAPSGGRNGDSAPAPARVGAGTVLSGGRLLQAKHQMRLQRVGGALSVAKDRVTQLEEQHVKRYGFLPEQRHQIELVGGQKPGKGAAYIGDYAPSRSRRVVARAKNVTGKGRKPDYQHQSRGILFTEGRARRSSKQVLRDFVATARSLTRKRHVEEAAKFSRPLNPESPNLLDHGHVFFNPEGYKIPRRLQEGPPVEELEQMLPAEIANQARGEYDAFLRQVFVSPEDAAGLLDGKSKFAQAVRDGKVRQIDRRIADAFGHPGVAQVDGLAGHLLDLLDLSNNITRLGVIYGKGSFVPMNFAGNVGFLAVQQGPWVGVNLAKAAGMLGDLKPERLRRIDLEVGSGAALSISHDAVGPLGRTTRAIGHASNVLADLLPRRAAWIHEAAKRGVKTDADAARLFAAADGGSARAKAKLNQISEQAEKAMVQFRGLGPTERSVLTRTIFIYPWLKGATKYLGRMPLDRPVQADLAAHLGQQGYDDTVKKLGAIVSFLQGIIPTGKVEHRLGTDLIPVRNPAALTPLGTGAQTIQMAVGLLTGHSVPAAFRLTSLLQPTLSGLLAASTHTNPTTGHQYPGDKGFLEILYSNLADSFAVEQTIKIAGQKRQTEPFTGSPANQRLYVQEGGFGDALKQLFEGGFRKRYLNVPAQQAKARGEQREGMTSLERAKDDLQTFRASLLDAAAKTRLPIVHGGKLNPGVQIAVDALAARKLNRLDWAKRNGKHGQLTVADRLAADLDLLARTHKIAPQAAKRATVWAQRESRTPTGQDQVQKVLDALGQVYFHRGVLSLIERALKQKGTDVKVPAP